MRSSSTEALTAALQRFGLPRDRMRSSLASAAGMTAADLDALEDLEADGPLTLRELGDRLALTSGAIRMLVDRLERAGWVERRRHPSDRRYTHVALSDNALSRAPAELAAYHSGVRELAAAIPSEDRDTIHAFLLAAAEQASAATAAIRTRATG